jgi:flagellar hook assembly protein FlgD
MTRPAVAGQDEKRNVMCIRGVRVCAVVAVIVSATAAGYAQTFTTTPSQVYVVECQETFVTLSGSNLTGASSTLVDFAGNGQVFELAPNTATPTQLQVWIPMPVATTLGQYSVTVKTTDTNGVTTTIGPVVLSVVSRTGGVAPVPSLPEVVVADATSSSGAFVTFNVQGASCDHASGSLFPIGTTTVSCSVTNSFGTGTNSFSVVVNPLSGTPPILGIPEIVVAEGTSPSGANVTFDPAGASCDRASGSLFPMGDATVTCTQTNSFGTSTGKFLVVVTDTVRPALSLPSNINTGNPAVTYTATSTDNIDGAITPVCSPASGSTFPNGTTVVLCIATDSHANSVSGSFTVTVTTPKLSDFTASQNVYQLNPAAAGSVTYTSNVPLTLTETLTIRSEATGATVRTLVNAVRTAGSYQDVWNGTNDSGQLVPDGTYRYFVTVSANGTTVTWDDGTHFIGTTQTQLPYPKCRNSSGGLVPCSDSSINFDPYANMPLLINYCVGDGDPPACSGSTPYVVIIKAPTITETDPGCNYWDCLMSVYQSSGAHEVPWYGGGVNGSFLAPYAVGVTVIRRNDIWPRNLTLVYGTAPAVSNFTISSPIFNPAAAPSVTNGETFNMTVTTFQARSVTLTGQFKSVSSGSILRTITTASQSAGQVTLNWNGRADNGAWVAPGLYEATITVTDSAGGFVVLKPLITVRYE